MKKLRERISLIRLIFIILVVFISRCAPTLKEVPEVPKEAIEAERLKQRKLALFTYFERKERLNNVWYNLLIGAVPFCKNNLRPIYGFEIHDKKMYKKEDIKLLREKYFLNDKPTVWYVHPKLPAKIAGLKVNDKILKINGKEPKNAQEAMEIIKRSKKLDLVIERNGKVLNLTIMPSKGCNYEVYLIFDESINAWAAPQKKVFVTTGIMRFVKTEKELALILGHELSHHVLGHITKKMGNVILGSIIDILIAAVTGVDTQGTFQQLGGVIYSKQFEREADYLGTYIAARGGYDISDAAEIWRRMAVEFPNAISETFLATHPSTPERFLIIEKTVKEIEEKKLKGEPLLPSKKFFDKQNKRKEKTD
ncbi:MAG: Outer membrane protein chaperone/metalloprotease BepA/YfgC [Thermodesulfobacteria bacterium]|nr:M48 family metallopeptidase [Thermodesulfobacteriota bacterium]MCU4138944.1 Outer membrane protein chaperone/metalloprotease BepA/YfgC [Thermodesulfobacteriota bacterium]